MNITIRALNKKEITDALPLVWRVFCEFEAVNYTKSGQQAFFEAIHSQEYLDMLTAYGAFNAEKLIGIIAARNEGSHISLFFVDEAFHRQGIGRELWNAFLKNSSAECITVHSSLYAVKVYERLGFKRTSKAGETDGIRYVPMMYRRKRTGTS